MRVNHPYAGPQWNEFSAGSFTISTAGTTGPDVPCEVAFLCMDDTTTSAYLIGTGDTSVTKGARLDGTVQYIPCQNLNNLKYRGSANSVTVNYTVGR